MVNLDSTTELRRRFDGALLGFLEDARAGGEAETAALIDELEATVRAGGKRLRPRFCYWAYRAAGGADSSPIIRAGAALELLHTFALIFDDVMDASPVRRRRPSSFTELGVPGALLSGLLGFVLADELLWTSGFDAAALAAMAERYGDMRVRAIAGQYMDLLCAQTGAADEATVRRIGALKSGSYSVAGPLAIGALAAHADEKTLTALEAYASPLGEAFQIADDVAGVFGDTSETGKDGEGDLRQGKQTVLLYRTREMAADDDRAFVDEHVGSARLDDDAADRVRQIMSTCGALDATRELVRTLCDDALTALDRAAFDRESTAALRDLAFEAAQRER